jgi:twinkle protein
MKLIPDDVNFEAYFAEQEVDAAKVKPASAWLDAVIDRFHGSTTPDSWTPTGFRKTAGKFDLRPNEVTLWAGINGHGKTTYLSHAMLNVMQAGKRVCLASLEMPPAASMAKMTRQAAAAAMPAVQFIAEFHRWTDGRLWIYDHVGKVAPSRMLALATWVRKELGIDHLVIDSLMKCGLGTDDYTGQKDFVDGLCAIARDTGLHIHLVCHMRKGETERKAPDKFDVKGAGEIADLADNILIVWKNQRKQDEVDEAQLEKDEAARSAKLDLLSVKPDAFVRVTKQRHFEFEGGFSFWFDRGSQQFLEAPKQRPRWVDVQPQVDGSEPL